MANYNADDLTKIKLVTHISIADFDAHLLDCLTRAYDIMNIHLKRYIPIPLTGSDITLMIQSIEADIAGGLFKEEKTVPKEGERTSMSILRKRGMEDLLAYIGTNWAGAGGQQRAARFRHGRDSQRFDYEQRDPDVDEDYDS